MSLVKVSIIIPVYNVEKYIEACLNSVFSQSYKNIECVIVNDVTPDGSMNVVKSLLDGYKGDITFKVIDHEQNSGLSAARNTGIENSTGDYLFFLDSDDTLPHDAISELIKPISRYHYDFVIGEMETIGVESNFKFSALKKTESYNNNEIFTDYLNETWHVMACNKLISSTVIRENSLYFMPGVLHEDELWTFRLATVAKSMKYIKSNTYNYIIHESSITQTYSLRKFNDLVQILTEYKELLLNEDQKTIIRENLFIERRSMRLVINMILHGIDNKHIYDSIKKFNQTYNFKFQNYFHKYSLKGLKFIFPLIINKKISVLTLRVLCKFHNFKH